MHKDKMGSSGMTLYATKYSPRAKLKDPLTKHSCPTSTINGTDPPCFSNSRIMNLWLFANVPVLCDYPLANSKYNSKRGK